MLISKHTGNNHQKVPPIKKPHPNVSLANQVLPNLSIELHSSPRIAAESAHSINQKSEPAIVRDGARKMGRYAFETPLFERDLQKLLYDIG
jgi:hypothetical protein